MMIRTFEELRERAKALGPRRVAVVSADDEGAALGVPKHFSSRGSALFSATCIPGRSLQERPPDRKHRATA